MSTSGAFDAGLLPARYDKPGLAVLRVWAGPWLNRLVAFWIFCGAVVAFEPSPYELTFLAVLPVAVLAGIGLYRSTLGMLALLVGFTGFALIACFQVRITPLSHALLFSIVTVFLMVTSYFLANFVAEHTVRRMRLIMGAYTAAALMAAGIGTTAYLGLLPGADLFLLYGRAKAMFNDPNVYGPFLVLPAMFALQRILLGRGWQAAFAAAIYLALFIGVFASFSRAAWGHFALSSIIVLGLVFFLEAGARDKVRIMIMSLAGVLVLIVALGGLLSIPAVGELFETRASSQNYDSGETGRFGRQGYAFELALENPLGIGPGEFNKLRIIEEPHNVYVSVLHVYGWGGGFLFYVLIAATLWKGFAALLRPSPYRLMAIPLFATFTMLAGESAIIDSDHWRHLYLIIGLIWGIATAIGNDRRRTAPREDMLV